MVSLSLGAVRQRSRPSEARGEQPACERQRRASKIEASAQTWARMRYAGDQDSGPGRTT
jgi:hypothetical protein